MARARMIQPEFWDDPKMGELPIPVRLLYIGLWTLADDSGNVPLAPALIRSRLFPYDTDLSVTEVAAWVEALVTTERLREYRANGERYALIVKFHRHQRISHPAKWRYPLVNECDSGNTPEDYRSPPETLPPRAGETETETETETERNMPPAPQDGEFAEFWRIYPPRNGKRLEKGKTQLAYRRLSKTERTEVLVGVAHYRAACDEGLTIPKDPLRWLQGKCWSDWQTPAAPQAAPQLAGQRLRNGSVTNGNRPSGPVQASAPRRRVWNPAVETHEEFLANV